MDIQEIIQSDPKLATLPNIYFQFREVVEDPEFSFIEVAKIILSDPALSQKLLRIVNSAFYGFDKRIETVTQAIGVVGIEPLNSLILSTVVQTKFKGIPDSVINLNSFWRHSIASALIAKFIAEKTNQDKPEKFYIAALLHDIGWLVLCNKLPDKTVEILTRSKEEDKLLQIIEIEELGFDHARLGEALLKQWGLPQIYQEAVGFHHSPQYAPVHRLEATATYLSTIIADSMHLGCSGESFVVPNIKEEHKAWKQIQLPIDVVLPEIESDVEKKYEDTVSAFILAA